MRQIIFIIAFSLIGNAIFSQTDKFNKLLDLNGDIIGITSILQKDTSYIIAGGNNCGIGVYLLNSHADTVWLKCYYDSLIDYLGAVPNNFKKTTDGNYIATGTAQNGIATYNRLFLLKLDSNFNKLYMKAILNDTTCDGCLHGDYIFENNNHDYILLGGSSKDSLGVSIPAGDALLIKTNPSGNIMNYKLYTGPYNNNYDWLNCGFQMGNYYYLFGGTNSYAPPQVTGFDRQDGWVVKTDMQGNEIISAAFGYSNLYNQDFKYALKIFGNKLLTGHFYSYEKNTEGFLMVKPWILLLDSNLNIFKEIFFKDAVVSGDTLFSMGNIQIVINKDSSLCILGIKSAYNMNLQQVLWKKSMITIMDKNFKVKFSRNYIHNGGDFTNINPYVINTTVDGGYIFGGSVVDNTLNPIQQSWLVKTDSLGCDGLHSCNDTALVIQILQPPDTICLNDTAWLHIKFKGRSAPYFVYANNTLALDSVYYPYTLPLWIDTLMPYIPHDTGMQQIIVKIKDPWGWQQSDTLQTFVKNCHSGFASEEFYKHKIEIYPNPATTAVHVRIRGELYGKYTVTLYNMQGNPIQQITTSDPETTLDISKYPQGVYNIRVLGNNMARSERVVKNR